MDEQRTYPRLGGVHEVAELIGLTRQATGRALNKPDAPAPIVTLRMGPVYDLDAIADWDMRRKKTTGPAGAMERLGGAVERAADSMEQLRRASEGTDTEAEQDEQG